jgi:hypothetical protein
MRGGDHRRVRLCRAVSVLLDACGGLISTPGRLALDHRLLNGGIALRALHGARRLGARHGSGGV